MEFKEYMELVVQLESAKALILVLEAENKALRETVMPCSSHFELLRES